MEALYFLAIVPEEQIANDITALKHEVAAKFSSSHALNSPPHITLHMPFNWKDKKLNTLKAVVEKINSSFEPFEVELNGFDFFEPRVVFVNVLSNDQLNVLQSGVVDLCRKQLKLDNANYKDRPFHPHITVGFRDLKKPAFYEAKAHFEAKSYSAIFLVEKVSLLKHDGKVWRVEA